jgi:hypothetical protein
MEELKEIYSNDFIKIIEDKNKSIFKIEFAYSNQSLINSLIKTKIIQGGTATDNYKSIKFKAHSIKSFNTFKEEQNRITGSKKISINIISQMISTLSLQLNYLITKEFRTVLGYNPENLIVINDKKFAFLGSELVTTIEDNMAQISFPFTKTDFFVSPELLKIKEIPSYIHYKTAYFSLGCLVLYALLADDDFYHEYLKHEHSEKLIDCLNTHTIKHTKLYWLLSRCLVEEPKKRSIILI